MNIAIISSLEDKASVNIKENLINNFGFVKSEGQFDNNDVYQSILDDKNIKLYTINSKLIFSEDLDKKIDANLFIFISRHSAKDERKSLTVHVTGNFGKAEFGGKDRELCTAYCAFMKGILIELDKNSQNSEFEATMEATHHGPYLEKPVLFVEIGSSEKEWEDREAGSIVAKSMINAMKKNNNDNNNESINKNFNEQNNNKNTNYESVFVIGGSHYNHAANKVMLKSNLAVGHICAKYNLENLDETLIKKAMEKAVPKSKFVLLDWKGLGKEKQRILEILERNNIEFKRSDRFFKE